VAHEVPRTPLPRQVQILHQERGHDHPHAIVHPARAEQLAHAGVDDGITGAALAPRGELGLGLRAVVDLDAVHATIEVAPTGVGMAEEDVGVELAPGQFAPVVRVIGAVVQVVQQLSRMHDPPSERGRQTTRTRNRRIVAALLVAVEPVGATVAELGPLSVHRVLRRRWQRDLEVGSRRWTLAPHRRSTVPVR